MRRFAFAITMLTLTLAPLAAQSPRTEVERTQAISFSPILALFEVLQAEYERKLGEETTGALGVGYFSFGDDVGGGEVSWLAVDLKGRFYPNRALEGFAIGGIIGAARVGFNDDVTGEEDSATGLAFGVDLNWTWLLGDTQRWFLATGIGAKRYYFGEVDDDIPLILPTGRVAFGLAF
ncbi:MAG TPA: hypothetical protein VMN78_01770 [Longimicrobiales bacterium]|nr:hypothetical protein [Longimicrobiales bacterium]